MVKDYIRPRLLCEIVLPESLEVQKHILHMVCFILAPPCECEQYQRIPLPVYTNFCLLSPFSGRKNFLNCRHYFSISHLSSRTVCIPSRSSAERIMYIPCIYSQSNIYRGDYKFFVWFSNQNERYFYNTSVCNYLSVLPVAFSQRHNQLLCPQK